MTCCEMARSSWWTQRKFCLEERAIAPGSPLRRRKHCITLPVSFCLAVLFLFAPRVLVCQEGQNSPPNGQAIFLIRCAKCHGFKGEGVSAAISLAGPSLQAVHNPGAVMTAMEVGPSHMPSFAYVLSVQEMQAVATFVTQQLAVIPLSGGNLSDGGKLFRIHCAPCHRTAVRGGALVFTGVNAPALTDYSAAMIAGAIRQGPGPMPSFPGSILSNQQVASVVDYVIFVQHPPSPGGNPLHFYGPVVEGVIGWIFVLILIAITRWIERGGKG
ncbi:MAG TPA: c-type cytochrome [Terriglobia bacterium]|nr:c-type cytochrome [Terriglobia bacterium]